MDKRWSLVSNGLWRSKGAHLMRGSPTLDGRPIRWLEWQAKIGNVWGHGSSPRAAIRSLIEAIRDSDEYLSKGSFMRIQRLLPHLQQLA